jgi:hypothetical protein
MPGYTHSIYRESSPGGIIHLEDQQPHLFRIEIKDANGNTSTLEFKARYNPDHSLHAESSGKMFYPGMIDGLEMPSAGFYLEENCLYDSLHLILQESGGFGNDMVSDQYKFGNTRIPLADTMTVRIKLNKSADMKQKVLMRWSDGDDYEIKKPAWLDDWATATFRSFGTFSLVLDTVPPTIRFPGMVENSNMHQKSRIAVSVQDNYKKIKNFRAELDGNWLLFTNDKAKAYIYSFDEHCPAGKHELKIYAEDEAGNASSTTIHFVK